MTIFKVEGISCSHCVAAIKKAVHEAAPAVSVEVDIARGEVRIAPDADRTVISDAIRRAGYTVRGTV